MPLNMRGNQQIRKYHCETCPHACSRVSVPAANALKYSASRNGLRARSSVLSASNHSVVVIASSVACIVLGGARFAGVRLIGGSERGHYRAARPRPTSGFALWQTRLSSASRVAPHSRSEGVMIKVLAMLRRRAGVTREEFHRWWIEEHVPYAKVLPGLRKYGVCLVTGSTSHEGREPWDGIAELWFDDRAALDAAWSSEIGQAALAHSRASHADRLVLITEEHVIID